MLYQKKSREDVRCITNKIKKMKQTKFLTILLCAGMVFTACDENNGMGDSPEKGTAVLTFEENMWNAFIDNPQYNGTLLYGENAKNYGWQDPKTKLCGGMTNAWGGMYGFSEGGVAVSNYIDANTEETRNYEIQLSVPKSNGSKNFAVVYCNAGLEFSDGKAREIVSMDICPTTYTLSIIKNGDGYAKALTEQGDHLTLSITGYNNDTQTGTVNFTLSQDGNFMNGWETKGLSRLGKVTRVSFSMDSNDKNEYGVKAPCYFAFDNVKVKQ